MKTGFVWALAAPLAVVAVPHAKAADVPLDGQAAIVVAANSTSDDIDQYKHKAEDEMHNWGQRLHDFAERAKAEGDQVSASARDDLDKAWHKTEEASRRLQTASADGWDKAKGAYERAVDHLQATWDHINAK